GRAACDPGAFLQRRGEDQDAHARRDGSVGGGGRDRPPRGGTGRTRDQSPVGHRGAANPPSCDEGREEAMNPQLEAFTLLLQAAAPAFTQPSFALFSELICAWVYRPTRRTVTAMIRIADPQGRRAHDAYHRFLRAGAWSMARLWRVGAAGMVATFYAGRDVLVVDLDDTLFHKSGRKVEGAGNFRDPIRSRAPRIVYALGLNLVVLTLRVSGPWGGEPLGLPMNCRLFRKGGADHNQLACEMLGEVAGWFPTHRFVLCGDGAYASLVADGLERTQLVSRMRRNAALYEPAPQSAKAGP